MKKFYLLALCTVAFAVEATAQETTQPMTRPRRVQTETTQAQPQATPQPSAPQASSAPTPQPTPTNVTPTPTNATPTPVVPEEAHDYAPIRVQEFNFKKLTFKTTAGEPVNLREWARGKRLVLVEYFAPWCRNSKLEAGVVASLYDKYHALGFDVLAVSEYGTAEELKDYLAKYPVASTLVVESNSQDARAKTTHYAYRVLSGDTRKWGTPFNVFLDASSLNASGDTLALKLWTASGELVPAEAERFIRERLGLPAVP